MSELNSKAGMRYRCGDEEEERDEVDVEKGKAKGGDILTMRITSGEAGGGGTKKERESL
jgi:hypothetical protein